MTLDEKQEVAAAARQLIYQLELCDDGDFVDFIISCVASADLLALQPEYL